MSLLTPSSPSLPPLISTLLSSVLSLKMLSPQWRNSKGKILQDEDSFLRSQSSAASPPNKKKMHQWPPSLPKRSPLLQLLLLPLLLHLPLKRMKRLPLFSRVPDPLVLSKSSSVASRLMSTRKPSKKLFKLSIAARNLSWI